MEVLASVKRRDLLSEPAHWRLVSIPLELLEWTDAHLKWIRLTRDVQGTFYVDDIRFVPERMGKVAQRKRVRGAWRRL